MPGARPHDAAGPANHPRNPSAAVGFEALALFRSAGTNVLADMGEGSMRIPAPSPLSARFIAYTLVFPITGVPLIALLAGKPRFFL